MRKLLLSVLFAATTFSLVSAQNSRTSAGSPDESREEKRKERIERREQRTAEYIKYVDSLVLARSFSFIPLTFQMQPAGTLRQITNTSFQLNVYPSWTDVYLPYISGVTPPYYITILNYALPRINDYQAMRTPTGWKVTFNSTLFSANTYNFELDIISATGSATLTISSVMYNTVEYSGQFYRN